MSSVTRISAFVAMVSAAFVGMVPPAAAEQRQESVPQSREEISLSFSPVVKRVTPAVVNIYTRKVVQARQSNPLMDDPFFRRFFGDDVPFGIPREQVQNALGSGVIVRGDGVVVTNNHVVAGADSITVALQDRREFEADLVGRDERTDLAVLRLKGNLGKLPTVTMAEADSLEVGDLVLAIGNPFGVGQTVTSGIVSALARTTIGVSDFRSFIQTDAAINPGNSGGALVDVKGRLVGINTAIYSRDGGNMGLGFAIPVEMVHTVLTSILEKGKAVRPWLGVGGQPVEREIAASLGLDRPGGVLINMVAKDSPAERSGLKVGDVVVAIQDKDVPDAQTLRYRIAALPVGGKAALTVIREGKVLQLDIPLEQAPEKPAREETDISGRNPLNGARLANLNPALAEELGIPLAQNAVIILGLDRRGYAAQLGLRPGDFLRAVNGKEISSVSQAKAALAGTRPQWTITVEREGRLLNFSVN